MGTLLNVQIKLCYGRRPINRKLNCLKVDRADSGGDKYFEMRTPSMCLKGSICLRVFQKEDKASVVGFFGGFSIFFGRFSLIEETSEQAERTSAKTVPQNRLNFLDFQGACGRVGVVEEKKRISVKMAIIFFCPLVVERTFRGWYKSVPRCSLPPAVPASACLCRCHPLNFGRWEGCACEAHAHRQSPAFFPWINLGFAVIRNQQTQRQRSHIPSSSSACLSVVLQEKSWGSHRLFHRHVPAGH